MTKDTNSQHLAERFKKGQTAAGYPKKRLVLETLSESLQGVDLPDGPWTMQTLDLPTPEKTQQFIEAGHSVDSLGRPLHPWFREMVTNPEIGVVVGNGEYWYWGPNATADPIVLTNEERPRIALITRLDGSLAFPGGFVDEDENGDARHAALRELREEAGLVLDQPGILVYNGIVADTRTTANSWGETSAYLFTVDKPLPLYPDLEEVKDAAWYYVDELPDRLFGSHAKLLAMAMELYRPAQKTISEILSAPDEEQRIIKVDAGHMAYDHQYVIHEDDYIFCKKHIASRFTEANREKNSRWYLKKELAVYKHVRSQGYNHIPKRIELIDGTILAMDAFHPDKGWLLRAPSDEQFPLYVDDAIAAFDALQQTRIPHAPKYEKVIAPTYPTFWKEGWDAINDEIAERVVIKINDLANGWSPEQKTNVARLVENLEELRTMATTFDRNPQLFMAHNDARQSNLGWHPKAGSRLFDWSWAGPAPKDADTTMMLIDLTKSGHDISPWMHRFNKEYAVTLIGMWLAHSMWETRDGNTTVREHQAASAVAAFKLLSKSDNMIVK